jgi:carboxyl-terminal processing protease
VSNFRENTLADFDAALREILDGGATSLILDLRFNPGGLMQQGIAMADCFLESGLIVSTVTRLRAIEEYNAVPEGTVGNIRLVILVNGGSASSAEIVAGALQARKRATIVGERSFGKGSVQHLIHLQGHQAAVKLTVAYYRLPDGRIIHRTEANAGTGVWGVTPNVVVPLDDTENQAIRTSRAALDAASSGGIESSGELLLDRQLREALSIAKNSAGSPN